jgi:hypothetical protein
MIGRLNLVSPRTPGPIHLNGETIQWVGKKYIRVKWEYHMERFEVYNHVPLLNARPCAELRCRRDRDLLLPFLFSN